MTLSFPHTSYSQDDWYIIKGRVVDIGGRAVSNADLCVEPVVRSVAFDSFVECVGSERDGTFELKKIRSVLTEGRKQELYVYFGTSEGLLETISPPFYGLRRYDNKFHGVPLLLGRESTIDVGDVTIQFWYAQVNLDFSRYKSSTGVATIDWDRMYLRIRNAQGHVVYESSLSYDDINVKSYIDRSRNVLKLSVPEGRWRVEVVWKGRVRATSPYFDVHRSTSPITTMLRPT